MMLAHKGPRNPRRGHLLWLLRIQRPTRTQQSRKERPLPIKRPLSPQTPRQRGPSPTVAIPRGRRVPPNPSGFPQAVANGPLFSCKYFKNLSFTSSKLYLCLLDIKIFLQFSKEFLLVMSLLTISHYLSPYTTSSCTPPLYLPLILLLLPSPSSKKKLCWEVSVQQEQYY